MLHICMHSCRGNSQRESCWRLTVIHVRRTGRPSLTRLVLNLSEGLEKSIGSTISGHQGTAFGEV